MPRSILTVALLLVLAAPARAVVVVPLTFEQLVGKSSVVVFGRVIDVAGGWTDDRRAIESAVTVEVLDRLKGRAGERITFVVPGGQAGRYLHVMPGAPTLARGDVAVFFLSSRGARLPVTTGFTQGIYRADRASTREWIVRGDRQRGPAPLAAFTARVRAALDSAP